MQPFYLSKGKQGYYRVYFVNQATGAVLTAKSTHSKNKVEAAELIKILNTKFSFDSELPRVCEKASA